MDKEDCVESAEETLDRYCRLVGEVDAGAVDDLRNDVAAAVRRAYDAGLAAANQWHKASEPPKSGGYYHVLVDVGRYAKERYVYTPAPGHSTFTLKDRWSTRFVVAWRDIPPYEEAQR